MHTKAVYHAAKAFSHFGIPVLRFNFRGVGLSEGVYDEGRGEVDDARAAIEWMHHATGAPVLLAGFSFGANVGMRAGCGDPRVVGLVGLGVPLEAAGRTYAYRFLPTCTQPKLFVIGSEDPFAPHQAMNALAATAAKPMRMVWVPGAEHFFGGVAGSPSSKLDRMQIAIRDWLKDTYGLQDPS